MTAKQALGRAREILASGNIENAPLESELLLRHTLKLSRVELYLELDRALTPQEEKAFRQVVERRLSGEPTAYITRHREFYGLDFYVDPAVLIPRPESELLVEKALRLAQNGTISTIAEIGTGCGAIAISLALHLPQARIYATDISLPALKVARVNCQRHGAADRIRLLHGDMLDPLPGAVDLIIANLPYVRESELPPPPQFEPVLALDGGADGTDRIRRLCLKLEGKLQPGGWLLLEVGEGQGPTVTSLLYHLFPGAKIEVTPDLSGIDRMLSLSLAPTQLDIPLGLMLN
jgi:release factor glutamine methyltransferase